MRLRTFGRLGWPVSEIGYGMWGMRPLVPAGGSLPDLALRFILHHPAVSTTIPGMRRVRHVEANLAASQAPPLTAEGIAALRAHRWDRDWPIP